MPFACSIDTVYAGGYATEQVLDGGSTQRTRVRIEFSVTGGGVGDVHLWIDGVDSTVVAYSATPITYDFAPGTYVLQVRQWDDTNTSEISTSANYTITIDAADGPAGEDSDIFEDTFTDTDGTALSAHTSEGVTWAKTAQTVPSGTNGNTFANALIGTNRLYYFTNSNNNPYFFPDIDPATNEYFYDLNLNISAGSASSFDPTVEASIAYVPSTHLITVRAARSQGGGSSDITLTTRVVISGAAEYSVAKTLSSVGSGAHTVRIEVRPTYFRVLFDGVAKFDSRDFLYGISGFDVLASGAVLAALAAENLLLKLRNTLDSVFSVDSVRAGELTTEAPSYVATGIYSTAFGSPKLVPAALGFKSTAFGTPTFQYRFRVASIHPVARFGTPSTPTDRTQVASGFRTGGVGTPGAIKFSPASLDRTVRQGFTARSTRFGLAMVDATVTGGATGFLVGAFGTPEASQSDRCLASGLAPGLLFGLATAVIGGRATAFRATTFGTAAVRRTQIASGFSRTRFGTPAQWGQHIAYGIDGSGKFGQPTGFSRFNYPAAGFCSTALGTPAAIDTHHARHLAPGTRFGRPLLTRNPSC